MEKLYQLYLEYAKKREGSTDTDAESQRMSAKHHFGRSPARIAQAARGPSPFVETLAQLSHFRQRAPAKGAGEGHPRGAGKRVVGQPTHVSPAKAEHTLWYNAYEPPIPTAKSTENIIPICHAQVPEERPAKIEFK